MSCYNMLVISSLRSFTKRRQSLNLLVDLLVPGDLFIKKLQRWWLSGKGVDLHELVELLIKALCP